MPTLQVLVAGAHADDLEIGAAALIQRLLAAKHSVHLLVLTDDPDIGKTRRAEAARASIHLGLRPESLMFAGFPDGSLSTNRETVTTLRRIASDAGVRPDLVITHTTADSHNDHSQANHLLRAAFRGAVFMFYSIHISAEPSRFQPRFYTALRGRPLQHKVSALSEYTSQAGRIGKLELSRYEEQLGSAAGLPRAEAFEVDFQEGGQETLKTISDLNDAPFQRLWQTLIANDEIYLLYEEYTRHPRSVAEYSTHHESAGRDTLREAFQQAWLPKSPLHERYSDSPDASTLLKSQNIILAGGAVSNAITRTYFNRFRQTRWIIDYGMPQREPVFLLDKWTGRRYSAARDVDGNLVADLAVLTVITNPYSPNLTLVGAAGIHGIGTQAILRFLADPQTNPNLLRKVAKRRSDGQWVVWVGKENMTLRPFDDTSPEATRVRLAWKA